jgi:hypothetical protein
VAYFVDITNPDLDYLRGTLTPEGFEQVRLSLIDTLQNCSDSFREERRVAPPGDGEEGSHFELIHIVHDGGKWHRIRVVVDDSAAPYGVLQVVFLDSKSSDGP